MAMGLVVIFLFFILRCIVLAEADLGINKDILDKIAKTAGMGGGIHGLNPLELNSSFSSWGVGPSSPGSINLLNAWKSHKRKKEIVVAVVDTGIDYDHPFLSGNHYVHGASPSSRNYGVDFSKGAPDKKTPADAHGHGTHIAGIIRSVYPPVKILTLKYFNPNASGLENLNATIEALEYATKIGVDIINYSGGGPSSSKKELAVLKRAEARGIIVVAAAGNEKSNIDIERNAYYPASYGLSNIITVTAHDQKLSVLPSSNFGKNSVGLAAPGNKIKSALPGGLSGYLTGTSQATAFVSGVAALVKSQYPNLSHGDLKKITVSSAKREASLMNKCRSSGRLDAGRTLSSAGSSAKKQ